MNEELTCCLCGVEITDGFGNNPRPLSIQNEEDRCCDECNSTKVIPERIRQFQLLTTFSNN